MESNVQHFEKAQAMASANFMNVDGNPAITTENHSSIPFLKKSVTIFGKEMSRLMAILGGIAIIGGAYLAYRIYKK